MTSAVDQPGSEGQDHEHAQHEHPPWAPPPPPMPMQPPAPMQAPGYIPPPPPPDWVHAPPGAVPSPVQQPGQPPYAAQQGQTPHHPQTMQQPAHFQQQPPQTGYPPYAPPHPYAAQPSFAAPPPQQPPYAYAVGQPAPLPAPAPAPPSSPFGIDIRRLGIIAALLIGIVIAVVALFGRLSPTIDGTRNVGVDPEGTWQGPPVKLAADGVSNLPGGSASVSYAASDDLTEVARDADMGAGPHDAANWTLRSKGSDASAFTITHVMYEPPLKGNKDLDIVLDNWSRTYDQKAGKTLPVKRTKVDGHTAYRWSVPVSGGIKETFWVVPGVIHSYWIQCRTSKQAPRGISETCGDLDRAVEFKTPPEPVPDA
jgi:hypothetical protein